MYSHTTAQATLHPRYYLGIGRFVLCLGAARLCSSDWVTLGQAWREAINRAQVNNRPQVSQCGASVVSTLTEGLLVALYTMPYVLCYGAIFASPFCLSHAYKQTCLHMYMQRQEEEDCKVQNREVNARFKKNNNHFLNGFANVLWWKCTDM